MKKPITVCVIILFFVLSIFIYIPVSAVNTGFESHDITKDKGRTDKVLSNVNLQYITEEPDKKGINCFDVNENGLVAIVYDFSNTIVVYDSNGTFKYGYKFNSAGSEEVEWDGDNVNILFNRSDIILSVDPKGNVVGLLEIENTIDNSSYSNKLSSHKKMANGKEYAISDILDPFDVLSTEHSKLVVIDSDGTEKVIFDVTSKTLIKNLLVIVLVVLFCAFVIIGILRKIKKSSAKINH